MGKVPYFTALNPPGVPTPAPTRKEPAAPPEPIVVLPEPPVYQSKVLLLRETKASIALVDDKLPDISLFKLALDQQGYEITVTELAQAYETICRCNPSAIVLDADQPGVNWQQIRKKLQLSLSTITIPVLLISSPLWKGARN
jgi:hypothetical protein